MLDQSFFTYRQLDDFVEEDLFVGKEVKHKILRENEEQLIHQCVDYPFTIGLTDDSNAVLQKCQNTDFVWMSHLILT